MSEHLIKPYEISVWEDKLIQSGADYKFVENKLAVIGSNTMTGLNRVYDPVFNKKTNGERTLSFSLRYKYFDPYIGNDGIINPFADLLVNERKVKLYYDNQWYEFIIKDHTESSDGLEWTYTCTDAFVLELAKTGYNITFDSELNNNQGTAAELAKETLKDTEWQLGGVDTFKQLVAEPIYSGTVQVAFSVLNTDTNESVSIAKDTEVYVFYSYIKNKDGKFVQFIKKNNNDLYTIDSNNVITATNYRITRTNITVTDTAIKSGNTTLITIGDIETRFQANRLSYNQLTTYDPVMERTVDRFKVKNGDLEIYKYEDYSYTTSNIVMNYVTNGDNFNELEDGSLQGWNPYTDQSNNATVNKLELVTKPELGIGKQLVDLNHLSDVQGFLKVQFNGAGTPSGNKFYNTIYNSGIENNASFIQSISRGDKFVFRWRAGTGNINNLTVATNLRAIVAKYTQDTPTRFGYYYKHINPSDIILQFSGTPIVLNNLITGGEIVDNEDDTQSYVINDVPQTPSTKYIYVSNNQQYVWNGSTNHFDTKTNSNYLPYYYLTGEAIKGVSNATLTDSNENIGLFIYNTSGAGTYYLQDVQLTRFIPDGADNTGQTPILIGNIPTATSNSTNYYYVKPTKDKAAEDIITYTSLDELKSGEGIDSQAVIEPLYNEGSEKNLSISVSQSNCFDILQTIAETFECWIDLVVQHDNRGYITSTNGKLNKFVYLRDYVGKDNWAGFKYGINLNSIERNINSDEIVTKLIVDQSQSDYTDEGYVSIALAPSNQSGESYILNFDYYYSQNLLDRNKAEYDRLKLITDVEAINKDLKKYSKQRADYELSLTEIGSKRNVYTELVESAKDTKNNSLEKFEQLTGRTYDAYLQTQKTATLYENRYYILTQDTVVQKNKKYYTYNNEVMTEVEGPTGNPKQKHWYETLVDLTEEETVLSILGEIYTCSATINNYSGLLTNIEEEYWDIRKKLYGSENYKIKIWTDADFNNQRHVCFELNDYLPGFSFTFGGSTYISTVSKKYFDITNANDVRVTFSPPQGYTVSQNAYDISNDKIKIVKITSSQSFDGIEELIEQKQDEKAEIVKNFNNKYSRFIQEGTWNSTDYIDSERYYLDALQVSNTSAQPTVSYTINVVEVSQLEGLELYTFDAGDKSYIEDTEFFGWANVNGNLTPAREEVIVSEVEWHLDRPEENVITVQNYKTRFEDLFQRISATVQTVQYNEATYAKMSSLLDANGTINQNVLLDSLNNVSGEHYALTSDGSVVINKDQILVRNLTNPANCVILNSEGLRISADGGKTWKTAITGEGINADAVVTGSINTQSIIIGSSDNPSFRWDKSGISAYHKKPDGVYDLKTYVRYDEYGLYGIKNSVFKAESIDDILDKAHFAVTWDGFFIKNSYTGGGRVEITSDEDFRVLKADNDEKIKIGALEWEQNGVRTETPIPGLPPVLYGIRIKNNLGQTVMKTGDNGNLEITGTIYANAGEIGGMSVTQNTLHMNHTMFERGVGIYSDLLINNKPLFEISDINGHATFRYIEALGGTLGNLSVIDTLTVGDGSSTGLIESYNYIPNVSGWMINSFGRAEFSNATVRGHIEAQTGDFTGWVAVGDRTQNPLERPWIIISGGVTDASKEAYGYKAIIKTSNYNDGASYGWKIDSDGDAVFNNITARGAIKTAVFEYAEIQAVGGLFIFRPSSTIKAARPGYVLTTDTTVIRNKIYYSELDGEYSIVTNPTGNPQSNQWYELKDLIVKVEKPLLFAKIVYSLTEDTTVQTGKDYYEKSNYGYEAVNNPSGNPKGQGYYECNPELHNSWCKISNYTSDGSVPGADVRNILLTNGLSHVYRISSVRLATNEVTLDGGWAFVETVIQDGETEEDVLIQLEGGALVDMGRKDGSTNYGIGVNSSDNTVNLPARAISLFETVIDETKSLKVSYNYRGILGTLPELDVSKARSSVYGQYMAGTQGIYTDNMYIGDSDQYLAFYEDGNGDRHLKISAKEFVVGYDPESGEEIYWDEEAAAIAEEKTGLNITVHSSVGTDLRGNTQAGFVYVRVTKGSEVIDPVPIDIKGGVDYPTNPAVNDYFVKLSNETAATSRTARLKKFNGTTWEQVPSVCKYTWAFTDANGNLIQNAPHQEVGNNRNQNQFIYINESLVNKKININVRVDLDDEI